MTRCAGSGLGPASVEFPYPVSFLVHLVKRVPVSCVPAFGNQGSPGLHSGCVLGDGNAFHFDALETEGVALDDILLAGPGFLDLPGGEEVVLFVVLRIDPRLSGQAGQIDHLALVVPLFAFCEEIVDRFVVRGLMLLDPRDPLGRGASDKNESGEACRCKCFFHSRPLGEVRKWSPLFSYQP